MAAGALSPDWVSAYTAVPRSAVLPDLIWPFDMAAGRSVPVSRTESPDAWQEYADADVPVVTQWDDGQHPGTEPGEVPTSSASMPSVVFRMLQDMDLHPGHKVLEIGTATLWNALLMAHRAGPGNVTTMEVDGALAAAARATAARFGNSVRVVHGDGSGGHREGAPYDRIMATCGVRSVPFAWVEQCRPGGLIVAPWGTHYSHGDAVARLVVAPDGKSAAGRFTGPVEFMRDRDTARVWQSGPRRLWDEVEAAFHWWAGRGRPGHTRFGLPVTAEGERVWLDDPADSWALTGP